MSTKRTGPFAGLGELKKRLDEESSQAKGQSSSKKSETRKDAKKVDPAMEELAFRRALEGVVPLGGKSKANVQVRVAQEERIVLYDAAAEAEHLEAKERLHRLVYDAPRFEVVDDGRHVEGRRIEVKPATLRRLRHGGEGIDSTLDLHGFVASEAKERLRDFLRSMRARGERCVLIIHGKGSGSPGGKGVLRGEMSAWLSQGEASESVDAFATATPEHGGEGAMFVLLRR